MKQININWFEKLKAIIKYIEENNKEKSEKMKSNDSMEISDDLKHKLANYFRVYFL